MLDYCSVSDNIKKMDVENIQARNIYHNLIPLTFSILFIIFGIIQSIIFFGLFKSISELLFIPEDLIGGFVLILIGLIFLMGYYELKSGIAEGMAYVYVGVILSLFFLCIYLLIMLANGIEAYIFVNEDFKNWSPLEDFRPGIYISIFTLIPFILWRKKLSLKK